MVWETVGGEEGTKRRERERDKERERETERERRVLGRKRQDWLLVWRANC